MNGSDVARENVERVAAEGTGGERLSFRFHSRELEALGRDLVTSDVVAVMELVKNSYDAMATTVRVSIHLGDENSTDPFIEVADNGHGMDFHTVVDVWSVIGTPFRRDRPVSVAGSRSRTATGEKGLGRLSAARLGSELVITTRTEAGPTLRFSLSWDKILEVADVADAEFRLSSACPKNR